MRLTKSQLEYLEGLERMCPNGYTHQEVGPEFATRNSLHRKGLITQGSAYNSTLYTGSGVTCFRITDEGKAELAKRKRSESQGDRK